MDTLRANRACCNANQEGLGSALWLAKIRMCIAEGNNALMTAVATSSRLIILSECATPYTR